MRETEPNRERDNQRKQSFFLTSRVKEKKPRSVELCVNEHWAANELPSFTNTEHTLVKLLTLSAGRLDPAASTLLHRRKFGDFWVCNKKKKKKVNMCRQCGRISGYQTKNTSLVIRQHQMNLNIIMTMKWRWILNLTLSGFKLLSLFRVHFAHRPLIRHHLCVGAERGRMVRFQVHQLISAPGAQMVSLSLKVLKCSEIESIVQSLLLFDWALIQLPTPRAPSTPSTLHPSKIII